MIVYHHSHLHCNQKGHHFITSGFIGPQILNFERSLSLSRAPKQSCSALQNFSWRPWRTLDFIMIYLTLASRLAFIVLLSLSVPEIEDLRANKTTCNEMMAFMVTL
jgi:hypothetical protein